MEGFDLAALQGMTTAEMNPVMHEGTPRGHMPQLDGLRALAALAVVYSHWLPAKYQLGLPWGSMGVQLFFVISGFLITGILLQCRSHGDPIHSLKAFYARRALRIFPLYYAVLLLTFILDVKGVREMALSHAAYLSNINMFLRGDWNGFTSHFWTLAVEEQFYLVWPPILLLIPTRRILSMVWLIILIGVGSMFLLPILVPGNKLTHIFPTSNLAALGAGALLALARTGTVPTFAARCLWGTPIFLLVAFLRMLGFEGAALRPLKDLSFIAFATWLVGMASRGFTGRFGTFLASPPLTYLGRISYGIYILHHLMTPAVGAMGHWANIPWLHHGLRMYLAKAALTFTAASLSWRFFESPLIGLKRHFPYTLKGPDKPSA